MKRLLSVAWVGFGAFMILSGCGSGNGNGGSGGSCGNAAPCGGSLVGAWAITSSCVSASASMFSATCPTATATGSNLTVTGSVTYNADLTFTSSETTSGSVSVTLPLTCLMSNGITLTCAQATQALEAQGTFASANCVAAGTGCTCTVGMTGQTSSKTGTYTTTTAGLLAKIASDGTANERDYCVKVATMTQSPHPGATMMGQSVSGTLTFTKE